ncbi:MAG: transposase [Nitrospira defluvii]|nr:transposase [Nitrospira defluvii]
MARPGYPKNLREFRWQFATEAACVEYLIPCRWPEGFVWPTCSRQVGTRIATRPLFQYRSCRDQASAMAGTTLHRSTVSIQDWCAAAYHVASPTRGVPTQGQSAHCHQGAPTQSISCTRCVSTDVRPSVT